MDTAQWPLQERIMKPMEEMKSATCSSIKTTSLERKVGITRGRAHEKEEGGLKKGCPRCNSTNTKFCYYNNYSLTQPRYFCKTCKRYWTEGGTLRNIPVGGASRKNNKRSAAAASASSMGRNIYNNIPSSSTTTTTTSSTTTSSVLVQQLSSKRNNLNILDHLKNPKIHEEAPHDQDLNLGFTTQDDFKTISELIQVPNFFERKESSSHQQQQQLSALEMITGINSFFPLMPIATSDPAVTAAGEVYSNGCFSQLLLPLDYNNKQSSLSFSLEGGFGNGGYLQEETNGGRLLFPFEDLKQAVSGDGTTSTDIQQNNNRAENNEDSNGYWNGVIGGGGGSW